MKTLKMNWDGDRGAPFFRKESRRHGWYICIFGLNKQFDPKIPGFDESVEYEGEATGELPDALYVVTSKTLSNRAWYGGFKLLGGYPYVSADDDMGCYLNTDIKHYLKQRYHAGDRWAWIEYEEQT